MWRVDPLPFRVTRGHGQKVGYTSTADLTIKREKSGIGSFRGFYLQPSEVFFIKDCVSEYYDLSIPGEYEIIAICPVPGTTNMVPAQSGAFRVKILPQKKPVP